MAATTSRRALNRSLLARQHLLDRVDLPALEVVGHLVGMQSQLPFDPYLGLWSRIDGFAHRDLATPLVTRAVVRCTLMRGTIHLVTAHDALVLWPLMRPAVQRTLYGNQARELRGRDLGAFLRDGEAMLAEEPSAMRRLRDRVAERWPDEPANALAHAIAYDTPTVHVTPRGVWGESMQTTFGSMRAWLGRDPSADMSIDDLVLRYLRAFGPASPTDFQAWSALTRAREVFERLRPQLTTARVEDGRELYDIPDAPWPDPETPVPVRYLPTYDNAMLGLADRSRILDAAAAARAPLFAGPDADYGTVLVDGFAAAVHKIVSDGGAETLVVQPSRPLSADERDAVVAEGERVVRFLRPGAETAGVRLLCG